MHFQSTQYIIGSRLNRVETKSDKDTRSALYPLLNRFLSYVEVEVLEWYAQIHIDIRMTRGKVHRQHHNKHLQHQQPSSFGTVYVIRKLWWRQLCDTFTVITRYEYWMNQSITQRGSSPNITITIANANHTANAQWELFIHFMYIYCCRSRVLPKTFSIKFLLSQHTHTWCCCSFFSFLCIHYACFIIMVSCGLFSRFEWFLVFL